HERTGSWIIRRSFCCVYQQPFVRCPRVAQSRRGRDRQTHSAERQPLKGAFYETRGQTQARLLSVTSQGGPAYPDPDQVLGAILGRRSLRRRWCCLQRSAWLVSGPCLWN